MLIEVEETTEVVDIFFFFKKFNLIDKFLKDYNLKSLDEWNYEESDDRIILKYLDDLEGYYIAFYFNMSDSFVIYKVKLPFKG